MNPNTVGAWRCWQLDLQKMFGFIKRIVFRMAAEDKCKLARKGEGRHALSSPQYTVTPERKALRHDLKYPRIVRQLWKQDFCSPEALGYS